MLNHDRFDELASLAAIGELSPAEYAEFEQHKKTCAECQGAVEETSSLATAAFLAGSPNEQHEKDQSARRERLRRNIAQRIPQVVPVSFAQPYRHLIAAGVAAAFLLGAAVGTAVGYRALAARTYKIAVAPAIVVDAHLPIANATGSADRARFETVVAELQKRVEETRGDNRTLRDKLALSDQHTTELETRLSEVEKQSSVQGQELVQSRNDLSAARTDLAQAKEFVSVSQRKIDSLQFALADKEARLTEVSASIEREREMLSQGREVRDIMGARDLHIVDVIDRDGKGRVRKAFGRAFYTQGKSLIFYAFDLPSRNTADGKFVYAAWGSNSNNANAKVAHSLGIFYNDDLTQHRWAMKFDDPKLLEEIDTVFVTLEPAGRPFTAPTGKALLEAYFGTPPNHP